jgi:IS66 C-terminal element
MSKLRHNSPVLPLGDPLFIPKQRKVVPHEFVLDAIAPLSPRTRPMFGCLAVYVEDKIVLILRDKRDETADNGVWLATTEEYHESLRSEFPEYAILGRKNYLFAGSDSGGERAAAIYSLIGTAKLNGLDPEIYLRHVMERIVDHPVNRVHEFLPWKLAAELAPAAPNHS